MIYKIRITLFLLHIWWIAFYVEWTAVKQISHLYTGSIAKHNKRYTCKIQLNTIYEKLTSWLYHNLNANTCTHAPCKMLYKTMSRIWSAGDWGTETLPTSWTNRGGPGLVSWTGGLPRNLMKTYGLIYCYQACLHRKASLNLDFFRRIYQMLVGGSDDCYVYSKWVICR